MCERVALTGLLAVVSCLLFTNAAVIHQEQLEDGKNVIMQVVTPEEMDKILKENPNAVEMKATISSEQEVINGRAMHPRGRSIITYTLGVGREDGDSLVGSKSAVNDYDLPTSLSVTVNYPSSGTGAIITHVKVTTYQSNTDGRAYVTSGGLGKRNLVMVIEAVKTTYFDYFAYIYGK
ncbi:uncharacterized protein LOC120775499 [Bactrocera tryoni]|uniref:uncharacterized protein LOC120775499 n=1 Tax=Bactrocera tryoni TaxID=59916 RepID=UPI001A97D88B|nr:uncharacterized protein LOC120775499 [Bactrocera tryoni]